MPENLVDLDLSRFTRADIEKVREVGDKLKLMRRWFRFERSRGDDGDVVQMYSGDRGPSRYASYQIQRDRGGGYVLSGASPDEPILEARTIDAAIDAIPQNFFYSNTRAR